MMPYLKILKRKLISVREFFVRDFEVIATSEVEIYKANFLITLAFFYFILVLLTHFIGLYELTPYQLMTSGFGLLCTGLVPFVVKYTNQLKLACLVFVGGNFLATCANVLIATEGVITSFTGIWFVIQYLVAYLVCGQKRAVQYLSALFVFIVVLVWSHVAFNGFLVESGQYFTEQQLLKAPIILGVGLGFLHYITSQFVNSEKRLATELKNTLDERDALVNELNKKQFELMDAKHEAESAAKIKSDFLSTMSHEIRTPLNAVVGISHLLSEEQSGSDQAENLNILKFSTSNLLALVNDILDFNKIEAGKIELEKAVFDIKVLLESVQQAHAVQAREKNISLELTIDPTIPEKLQGDPTRLAQVMHNLVGNAIKFTNEGKVTVNVHCQLCREEFVNLHFTIMDTGIGIPSDKLEIIFDSFTQANADTTRRYGGTGLGLAITKRLIELHNSEIRVESEENVGSTFYFELSFPVVQQAEENTTSSFEQQLNVGDVQGKHILIAEDNAINVLIVKKHLAKLGVLIDIAQNGEEAVAMVKLKSYDLVLMDLHMPVMNGFEATQKIRAWDSEIPIVGLTASVEDEIQLKMQQVGINDWVFKPIEPDVLRAMLLKTFSEAESI